MQIDVITQTQPCLDAEGKVRACWGQSQRLCCEREAGQTDLYSEPQLPSPLSLHLLNWKETKPQLTGMCTPCGESPIHPRAPLRLWQEPAAVAILAVVAAPGEDFPGSAEGCAWQGGEMRAAPGGEAQRGCREAAWLCLSLPAAHGCGERSGAAPQNPNPVTPTIPPCPVCPQTPLDMREGHRGCHMRPWSCTGELRDVVIPG